VENSLKVLIITVHIFSTFYDGHWAKIAAEVALCWAGLSPWTKRARS